ncbi:MAG: hypothetical protein HZC41_19095 [Chloroflexi bacterium]|nr:hypothetical protein [Chloroflexota bacterium]
MSTEPLLKIENEVPFAMPIYWWIHLDDIPLDTLVKPSRHYERPFLAWETVRKLRNPFFDNGTGFEGYLVGVCHSPDEALARLIGLCQGILDNLHRLHRMDYTFRARSMKTLTGECSDVKAMYEWSAQLGAALARLRCNIRQNRRTERFQTETYYIVNRLPMIDYHEEDSTIEQRYLIGFCRAPASRVHVTLQALRPSEQDAWLVAQYIGRFGHPLVRQFLRAGLS